MEDSKRKPRLVVRGDLHGDIASGLSYAQFPELRNLDKNDTVLILGDTGMGWGGDDKAAKFAAENIGQKPFNVIYMFGNHDNYDFAERLPLSKSAQEIYGCSHMRQLFVNDKMLTNQFIVDKPCVADIAGYHCLLVPGADSHDIDKLLFPGQKHKKRQDELCRVIGTSWWPQEAIDVKTLYSLVKPIDKQQFDLILSHDSPAHFVDLAARGWDNRFVKTVGEKYLQALYETVDYQFWFHGHFHYDFFPYYNPYSMEHNYYDSCCLYNYPFEVEELCDLLRSQFKEKFPE